MRPVFALVVLTSFAVPGTVALSAHHTFAHRSAEREGGPTRLLRTPSISATHVAFAYANNIWIVNRKGGDARRLTSFQGQSSNPKISPDGTTVAFSADYAGNTDVYTVPVSGGEPMRLTWHPGADTVQGWTPDGTKIMFASGRHTAAPNATPRFWTVPAKGGIAEPLPLPRGYQGKISPDGRRVAYRMNTSWDEERRNYRGGQNRPVWIVDLKTFDLVSPPWTDSKDVDPAWLGDTVYFISDRDGMANVWSYDTTTKALTQRTKFIDYDVKSLDAGGGAVVFEQAGYLHVFDPKSNQSDQLTINAAGDFPWMMTRFEDVTARMSNISLSPTGKRVLAEARGEIFTIPEEKGDVRNISHSSGSAERQPAWSPDGKWISYFSDKSGEYKLVIESQDGIGAPREIAFQKSAFYYTPVWSPDSKKLLYTDTNLNVWVMDIATGQAKAIGNDPWMVPQRTLAPSWSPDAKWIAFASRLNTLYRAIVVANVETGEKRQITDGLADAMYPVWDASGKYLWFLASTDFGLASQWLDMTSYGREETFALYLAVLNRTDPSPLLPESDEDPGVGARPPDETAEKPERSAPKPPPVVTIDFDRLQQRILPVTGVPSRRYSQLKAGSAGTVFFLEAPGGAGARGNILHRFRLSERRPEQFQTTVAEYSLSADGKRLVYRTAPPQQNPNNPAATPARPQLFIVDADKGVPAANAGRLDVTLRMQLDPKAEFTQIFNEGWRLQRDYLYVPNMHGTNWPRMKEMYGAMLPHVAHRADLNYLLDNMGAEIAIGHSYVRGGAMPEVPSNPGGLLGADFAIEGSRYKIAKIYDGESWNPDLRAPLAGPGVNVSAGDFILAIDGVTLTAPDSIYRLLDGTANRQTVLTVNTRPDMQGARQVTVVPVTNEQPLRTRAWVEENRRYVDKRSNGQLAYVYVPNTGQGGFESFNRYYFAQQDKQGAVIDERYNGGGSAADYIIDVLQRDFDGYFNNVAGDRRPFTSPSAGIWGPKVMIINEMAGSGGDLMPWMFRYRKIGPLVGKRTWGGLVHTADTPQFIDGGSMIAPRGGFFTRDGKWAMENEGTAPDIDVENWPKDVIAGRDPQLERAVDEALRLLKEKPVDRRTTEPAPPAWGKRPALIGAAGVRADDPLAPPESVGFSTAGIMAFRDAMRALVDEGQLAGVTSLVARHGKVVHFDAYGVKNLESKAPLGKDTIFRIASMTKPIAGVAMMMLWEEGKWALDDPVSKHIPEFAGLKVATASGEVPQVKPMTMRQLMSHTAGFDVSGGYAKHNITERTQPLQAMIDKLAKLPLATQPGSDWRYGPSVDIQGYVVEKLSGQPLDVFLSKRIFEPLGMKDTGFWVDPAKKDRITNVHTYGADKKIITATTQGNPTRKPIFFSGSGGLLSTTEDYFKFAQMLLNGGEANGKRLLKKSTVELMRTNVLEPGVKVDLYGPNSAQEGVGFGLDFAIVMDPAKAKLPDGKNSFYWGGAFGTWFWIDPTNDLIVVGMMQNQDGSRPDRGSPQVRPLSRKLVYAALVDPRK